ncbi:hypothetical protein THMIRHAS_10290 [Thiosulfatimonas sediminis]|uniref:Uncharacterized protein n=1 Tax=Thiosulfatimonas sediminis TaxID=2675054 RepID=A0A6F8PU79_9GAMM|nr:hypothetical protein [Thiosulfatimonas sediminis]BBP45656.1 hypothetical protein THMIRHAS_10290 [Thiosulfatimonas sediminis]
MAQRSTSLPPAQLAKPLAANIQPHEAIYQEQNESAAIGQKQEREDEWMTLA